MSKSCKPLHPGLFLLGAATAALVFAAPQTCVEALQQGLALCGGPLLVSLFPFLVVSALIMRSGAGEVLGVLLWPVVRCIGLRSRSAGSVLLIGLVGGFAPAAAATAEAAGEGSGAYTGTPIKIGGIGPITGGAAVYGQAVKNAEELAVKEINAANGSDVFDWKFEDDEHDAEKSVNAYNTLKDWGLQVLAGPVTTTPSIAVAAETANDNMFMMTPSASAPAVIESGDNVFQICFTDPNQGVASADYIADNKLGTKVGVIYDSSDAYSSGIYEKFKAEAAAKNLEIVTAEAFTADNKSDLSTQVAKCQEAGADLVFLPIYYQEASQILIAANKSGYEPVFFGCDGMDGILSIDGFDTSLAEGLMLLTPFAADAQDEKTQAFVSAYKEAYGDTPNQFAADAYDVVYAIYEAVLAGGLNGDMDASDICDALKTQFTTMSFDGLTGDSMTWDASGAVSKAPKAVVIKDGAYAAM